jgi:glutathione peroxidase-family protein
VNGFNTAPLYKFLKSGKYGIIFGDDIQWNFAKFLIDKDGQVAGRYYPTTSPLSLEVNTMLSLFYILGYLFKLFLGFTLLS